MTEWWVEMEGERLREPAGGGVREAGRRDRKKYKVELRREKGERDRK